MASEVEQFLQTVITTPEGWFQLLIGPPDGDNWKERWYRWPEDLPNIVQDAVAASDDSNVYFSAHLFSEQSAEKSNVLPTRTIMADLDEADISRLTLAPTVLVQTSPGRHQGYWVLRDSVDIGDLEALSRRMTYSIPNCDRSGWSLGHKVRLPGTLNYKYSPSRPVQILSITLRHYTSNEIQQHTQDAVEADRKLAEASAEWINGPHEAPDGKGPYELFEDVKTRLPRQAIIAFTTHAGPHKRSEALWTLMLNLFRAGLSRDEVFWIAKHSPNNKFADARFHGDIDLAKDVDRAERQLGETKVDAKNYITEIRRSSGLLSEKRAAIAQIVIHNMEQQGEFVVTQDGLQWYLHRGTGRPIAISRASEYLDMILESQFGLNAMDWDTRFVVKSLQTFTLERGRVAHSAVLSRYEGNTILLHGGRKDVFLITPDGIDTLSNGAHGVLFPWRIGEQPFVPDHIGDLDDWASFMFEGHFTNAVDHTPEDVTTLIRVWFLFLLLRDAAVNRPILTLLGQPGSGKSTTFRMLYTLLYGPSKALNAVTDANNFDHLVSTDPLVVFDNVDTWASWLPDRMALSAAASDLVKRKLYTDVDIVIMKRQALIGLTAHNPKFGREDVIDRMLLLNFERISDFKAESDMIEFVASNRNRLWGGIVSDIQKVLGTPEPPVQDVPQFRITDFARIGYHIAVALGLEESFTRVLEVTKGAQTAFNLSEEDILIDAIQRWHQVRKSVPEEPLPVGALWEAWEPLTPGFERHYKSSLALGKKLFVLQETLRKVFDVRFDYDTTRGIRRWSIEPRKGTTGAS